MAKYPGQEYKQGIIIQRSPEGSAFRENRQVVFGQSAEIYPNIPGGIKHIDLETSIIKGAPLEVDELPVASEEYSNLVALVQGTTYYVCLDNGDGTYSWYEYVRVDEVEGLPIEVSELPDPSLDYVNRFFYNTTNGNYYTCQPNDKGGYRWIEITIVF